MPPGQNKIPVGLARALGSVKVPAAEVLAVARLPADLFEVPDAMLDQRSYFALWEAIATVSGDPSIGPALAAVVEPDLTEPLLLAMLSAADLGAACQVLAQYKRMLAEGEIVLRETRDAVEIVRRWSNGAPPP